MENAMRSDQDKICIYLTFSLHCLGSQGQPSITNCHVMQVLTAAYCLLDLLTQRGQIRFKKLQQIKCSMVHKISN